MEKIQILKEIASLEKLRHKLVKNFEKIAQKEDDNTLTEPERIDAILDLIKMFDTKIMELKALIEEDN